MIIGLGGYARSGKDTVGEILVGHHGFTRLAFADKLRELAVAINPIIDVRCDPYKMHRLAELVDHYGWDDAKNYFPEVRIFLQRLGTEGGRRVLGENFWVDLVEQTLTYGGPRDYVITDMRFPNEFDLVERLGGETWRVVRPGCDPANQHQSETALDGHTFDVIVPNMWDVAYLEEWVSDALLPATA